jgi:large subunit ribosomal protein L10
MAVTRQAKLATQQTLSEKLATSSALVVTEYSGLTVEQLTKLRNELRKADAEVKVAKNRLLKRAIEADHPGYDKLTASLKGPNAFVYVRGDIAQAAKSLIDFEKENEAFKIKAAVLDGELVPQSSFKAIADLPSKEVLLAKIIGSLVSPHRGLVTALSGVSRNLVQVIAAIRDKKSA